MEWTGLNELRESYLKFFESKGHLRVKSFPLVPQNDNSLLLINAGMAPLKPYFTGQDEPPCVRMTDCQKCIRTGDIENVGKTARHGTFFEMLGNWSFGEYFKEEAIEWAWEYCTQVLKIPVERLYVSVYEEDDEALEIWNKKIGLPLDKIFKMGKEDNFWEAGIDGPCGPCSEIYYDRGEEYGCGKPDCTVGCDCDRYMEFWNLVFTQFERHEDGTYTPLRQKNIDTGMGLERLAAMMQNVDSIFDVDTIKAVRDKVCEIAGCEYGRDNKKDISIRVITDHIRSVVFMASDGVLPSNEGRGYVMRRLLRRAVRHGKLLGINGKFIKDIIKTVVDSSKCEYEELEEKYDYISKLLENEEKNFNETIDRGMSILDEYIAHMTEEGKTELDGESCFTLSDTYGFPIDLTREILEEKGLTCDEEGFAVCMNKQKERARKARGGSKYMGAEDTIFQTIDKTYHTEFVGYDVNELTTVIDFLATDDELVENIGCGDEAYVICSKTPFYAESGGQVGDIGTITTKTGRAEVLDTQKVVGGKFAHKIKVVEGALSAGQQAEFKVDMSNRMSVMRNHSCAHLLQAALRQVLGEHVHQSGQLVDADRVRFDFSHFEPMTFEQLNEVERLVNEKIFDAIDIKVEEMPIDEAKKLGAMALFGEKYGDVVRVVSMGNFSVEFCGGTHLSNTSQIGMFKILSENSVAAGVRRIEGVTGKGLYKYLSTLNTLVSETAAAMKIKNPSELVERSHSLNSKVKDYEKEISRLKSRIIESEMEKMFDNWKSVCGVKLIATLFTNATSDTLRSFGDKVKSFDEPMIAVFAGTGSEKGQFLAVCTKKALEKGAHAGRLIQKVAAVTGGKGGGRPDMAMAGIGDKFKIDEALSMVTDFVTEMLEGKEE